MVNGWLIFGACQECGKPLNMVVKRLISLLFFIQLYSVVFEYISNKSLEGR